MPNFTEFPFYVRPDLSPYLLHLTKSDPDTGLTAKERLLRILRDGVIRGSNPKTGSIKGDDPAVCFMDVPFAALKQVLSRPNLERGRYEPYGLIVSKQLAYREGARPAIYLSRDETERLIPHDEWWRVVHFDASDPDDWRGWLHEREWRAKGDFPLPSPYGFTGVLVKAASECRKFRRDLADDEVPSSPRAIIPIQVVCQGLPYAELDQGRRFA